MKAIVLSLLAASAIGGAGYLGMQSHNATSKEAPQPVPFVASPYDECDDCSLQARQLAWSLDNQSDQWSADEYRAHRRGVWIWIGNADYGVQVSTDRSVSPFGFGWVPSPHDRRLIADAFARWKDRVSLHAADIHP